MLNKQIRMVVGGIAKQVRDACNELIEEDRLAYSGQARGTRYHLA